MPYNKDSYNENRGDRSFRGDGRRGNVPAAVRDDGPSFRSGNGRPKNDRYNRDNGGHRPNNGDYHRDNEGGRPNNDRFERRFDDRRPNNGGFERKYDNRRPDRDASERRFDDRRPEKHGFDHHFEERRPEKRDFERHFEERRPERREFGRDFEEYRPEKRDFERRFDDRPPQPERRVYGAPDRSAPIAPKPAESRFSSPRPEFGRSASYERETVEEAENLLVGRNPIREAIKAGREIEKLLIARGDLSGSAREIVAKAHEAGIIVQEVDKARLDAIYPNHQGMLAYVSAAHYAELDDIFARAAELREDPFVIILDGITDPHNLGAIIRTAECVGAHGVIIPERRSVGLTPAAVKASAGACEYMNVVRVVNINRTIDELKERGVWIVGTTMEGEDALTSDLTGPIALVIGAEGEGIAELTLKKCDRTLSLPMKGHLDSLNASVAAGVMMYAVMNARRG